jgi:hypothetical protein
VTSYIESAAGVAAGARTGLSNVAVAALFLLAMFCSPLATAIPAYATAPALILVGVLMTQSIAQIAWQDFSEAVPAFITMLGHAAYIQHRDRPQPRLNLLHRRENCGWEAPRNQRARLDPHDPLYSALRLSGRSIGPSRFWVRARQVVLLSESLSPQVSDAAGEGTPVAVDVSRKRVGRIDNAVCQRSVGVVGNVIEAPT